MVAGLADHTELVAAAGDDRLHQGQRAALFPEAPVLLEGLRQAGALTSCWSGAGPSLLAICRADDAAKVASEAESLLDAHGVGGQVMNLKADTSGAQVQELG
jgi:homoserine kinase